MEKMKKKKIQQFEIGDLVCWCEDGEIFKIVSIFCENHSNNTLGCRMRLQSIQDKSYFLAWSKFCYQTEAIKVLYGKSNNNFTN